MTCEQMSNEFDTLLNSYSNQAFFGEGSSRFDVVLDEYEKSVFLTQAQKQFVIGYYNGKNNLGFSFEEKEQIREAIDSLVKTKILEQVGNEDVPDSAKHLFDNKHKFSFYTIPDNLLFIVFEEIKFSSYLSDCNKDASALVIPSTHDELWHRLQNPFRGPSKKRVLRLNVEDNLVELVSDYPIGSYMLRYIEEPNPIILVELPDGLSIDGKTAVQSGSLPDFLHEEIVERAVTLILQSKSIITNRQGNNKTT